MRTWSVELDNPRMRTRFMNCSSDVAIVRIEGAKRVRRHRLEAFRAVATVAIRSHAYGGCSANDVRGAHSTDSIAPWRPMARSKPPGLRQVNCWRCGLSASSLRHLLHPLPQEGA